MHTQINSPELPGWKKQKGYCQGRKKCGGGNMMGRELSGYAKMTEGELSRIFHKLNGMGLFF